MKTSSKQYEIIVNYLQKHFDLTVDFGSSIGSKTRRRELWIQLANELNRFGPPVRNCSEWKSIWSDYKYNLKRKLIAELKLSKRKICSKRIQFNKTEETVIHLLGLREKVHNTHNKVDRRPVLLPQPHFLTFEEHNSTFPQGKYNEAPSATEILEDQNVKVNNFASSLSTVNISDSEETNLLEKDFSKSTNNEDNNTSTLLRKTLIELKSTQEAILKELQESNRHKRNKYAIDTRKLQLEQIKFEEQKLQNYEVNKQAYINIELKRKELELYEIKLKRLCTQCVVKHETETD